MTENEEAKLIERELKDACERAGMDFAKIKGKPPMKVYLDGDTPAVGIVNDGGFRQLSTRVDQFYMSADEAVSLLARKHPEVFIQTSGQNDEQKYGGFTKEDFAKLSPTARAGIRYEQAKPVAKLSPPARIILTPQQQTELSGLRPCERISRARAMQQG